MRLQQLRIENFRGFESLTLDFHPEVTVLVGANGSGKTTVLEAVVFLLANALKEDAEDLPKFVPTDGRASGGEIKLVLDLTDRGDTGVLVASHPGLDGADRSPHWVLDHELGPHFRNPHYVGDVVSIAVYYDVSRHARDSTPSARDAVYRSPTATWENAWSSAEGFKDFFRWFREREDVENAERIEDPEFRDPQLRAVRHAIEAMLPGFSRPRVRRPRGAGRWELDRPALIVIKDGQELVFDQLSGGERVLVALAGDIARRLAIANPRSDDPLQGEGVVLIDEVDLHLHPEWQAKVIPALRRTFPNVQLVVTTHSLIVLSYVPSECVRLLQDFEVYDSPTPTEGREPNALALEIYGIPLRPPDVQAELDRIARLIDDERFNEARDALDILSEKLGDNDRGIVGLQTALALEDI